VIGAIHRLARGGARVSNPNATTTEARRICAVGWLTMSASRGPRAAVHAAVRGIFIPVYARELDQTAHAQQPDRPMTLQ
jgi:hypothetical protein